MCILLLIQIIRLGQGRWHISLILLGQGQPGANFDWWIDRKHGLYANYCTCRSRSNFVPTGRQPEIIQSEIREMKATFPRRSRWKVNQFIVLLYLAAKTPVKLKFENQKKIKK